MTPFPSLAAFTSSGQVVPLAWPPLSGLPHPSTDQIPLVSQLGGTQGHLCTNLHSFPCFFFFLAVLGLCCCSGFFSSCGEWGLLSSCGARASHCAGFSHCRAQAPGTWTSAAVAHGLNSTDSIVVVPGLSCSMACGIFPDQGWSPPLLHCQAESSSLSSQGSPSRVISKTEMEVNCGMSLS